MTDMQRLAALLDEFGVKYGYTDDSEESPDIDDLLDTVIVIKSPNQEGMIVAEAYFFFTREGKFKDYDVLGGV